jgi:hypothetical protein
MYNDECWNEKKFIFAVFNVCKAFAEGAAYHFGNALGFAMAAYYAEQVAKIRRIEIGAVIVILIIAIAIMISKKGSYGKMIGITIFLCIIVHLIAQFAISQI